MPNLFGLDIANIVAASIAGAGNVLSCTLTKTAPGTRTGGSLTAGTNSTNTTHTFRGFVETKEVRRDGQVGASVAAVVTVLGATVNPAAVPEVNDEAVVDGVTYVLVELLARDPAAAVYEFMAEGRA